MDLSQREKNGFAGFSRLDLLVLCYTIVMVFGLAALFLLETSRSVKTNHCTANLKLLHEAMMIYSENNANQLPYVMLKYNENTYSSWDELTYPFVPGGYKTNSRGERTILADRILRCPSDTIGPPKGAVGRSRRTYSMSWHRMNKENWPPGPANSTGVGLWWSDKPRAGSEMAWTNTLSADEHIPSINLSMIPAPSTTLLLAEKARRENYLFHFMGAEIRGPDEHLDTHLISMRDYHQGRFNYLMVDGAVQKLLPEQSAGLPRGSGAKNIWTIRPDD
jgi:prepilin-type processing-associated H-X9-DG protein